MRLLVILLAWSFPYVLTADTVALQTQLNRFHSFQAHFTQTLIQPGQSQPMVSSGEVMIEKPNRFRWEVSQPHEQLFVSDGTTLWQYDKRLDQATKMPVKDKIAETPMLLLSGKVTQLNEAFTVQVIGANQYRLKPKRAESTLDGVRLSFDHGVLSNMTLKNSFGQTTSIEFTQVAINKTLSADLFQFTPPKGVDVLELD